MSTVEMDNWSFEGVWAQRDLLMDHIRTLHPYPCAKHRLWLHNLSRGRDQEDGLECRICIDVSRIQALPE